MLLVLDKGLYLFILQFKSFRSEKEKKEKWILKIYSITTKLHAPNKTGINIVISRTEAFAVI